MRMNAPAPAEERSLALARLSDAILQIDIATLSPLLIPAGGIELAFALPRAASPDAVACVHITPEGPRRAAFFGSGGEAVRSVLTAHRFDAKIRAAGVIRYSDMALAVIEDLLLQVCVFDRAREPPGITSMHWGVAGCCRDGVPDAVYDIGGGGREGRIRLFAEDPAEVARRIAAIDRNVSRAKR
jgi:hydroxymethylpyrimidine/phosphomethylpyrimidine kinase